MTDKFFLYIILFQFDNYKNNSFLFFLFNEKILISYRNDSVNLSSFLRFHTSINNVFFNNHSEGCSCNLDYQDIRSGSFNLYNQYNAFKFQLSQQSGAVRVHIYHQSHKFILQLVINFISHTTEVMSILYQSSHINT